MSAGRGALIAVGGLGEDAQTAEVSRLLAGELSRRSAPGAVLLTAPRGDHAAAALEPALRRRAIVVADVGQLDWSNASLMASAAVSICTFRADCNPLAVATATVTARCRWTAVITASEAPPATSAEAQRAASLPLSVGAVVLLSSIDPLSSAADLGIASLLGAVA